MTFSDCQSLLNRPILEGDVRTVLADPWAQNLRLLVAEYRARYLPVINGGFQYSNLVDGSALTLTCHEYRLWEYASVFLSQDVFLAKEVLDVGGAGSPLPFFLAERGLSVTTLDLQPWLVALCNYVGAARHLKLRALCADITTSQSKLPSSFALVTCISVLEHIPEDQRAGALCAIHSLMQTNGLLYLTFDYGTYNEQTHYGTERETEVETSASISDLAGFCSLLIEAGFAFDGNDPRNLPADLLNRKSAPALQHVLRHDHQRFGAVDETTTLFDLVKYLVRRQLPVPKRPSRFERHTFFRMFLRKR